MISDTAVKKEKKVSISANNDFDIEPIAYSFREPKKIGAAGSITTAAQPPYWLYHDHALGVIWMLFHKDKNYIGISQLQWCLRFLLDLKNAQGEYTGDVDFCIQTIQDILIERYSKLGTFLENSVEEKSTRKSKKLSKNPDEAIDAILDAERAQKTEQITRDNIETEAMTIKQENVSVNPSEFDAINETDNEEEGPTTEDLSFMQNQIQGTSTPKEEERALKNGRKTAHTQNSEEPCGNRCGNPDGRLKNEEIVSITYKEMIAKGSTPCTREYFTEDMYDDSLFIEQQLEKTANEIIRDGTSTGKGLADLDPSELSNFLNSSRKQHLEMIKKEIDRLYGLEKLMKNIDTDSFTAYVTEDLARRLENLQDGDIVNAAEEILK